MARKARNPGVGRGHGTRTEREITCLECGAVFLASRSDALRCGTCRKQLQLEHGRRTRPERYAEPGVGKGGYTRKADKQTICKRCFTVFWAKRTDAKWCPTCRPAVQRETRLLSERSTKYDACPKCGRRKYLHAEQCGECWREYMFTQRGEANPAWKGGRTITADGYIQIRVDGHYEMEHRLVCEEAHGPIPAGWHVHHLNGIKDDNRPENLVAMSVSDHHSNRGYGPYEARIRALEYQLADLNNQS